MYARQRRCRQVPVARKPGADALSARILVIRFSQVKRYFYNNGRNGRKLDVLRANTGENLSVWAVFECFWLDEI